MKSIRKNIGLIISSSLLLTSLSACGTQSDKNQPVERVTITYWDSFCANMLPDSYCESLIEANFPIDIVVNRTDELDVNQVSLLMSPQNVPDVFWTSEPSALVEKFGVTREIPRELVEEYAPSFLELYDTYPTIYTSIMNPNATDEFFALNGVTEQSAAVAASLFADYYRYDWIEALDIDLGVNVTQISDNFYVADTGLTLDKFEEVMHGFTYGDPDGNGIDDTQGASFEHMSRFDLLYSGFDMVNGINESNGRAEFFYATENFKDFSIWFSDLLEKGYIDDEFFYQDQTARREKVNNEQIGYFLESSIAVNSWAVGRPPLSLIEKNPDVKFLITPGLSNNDGFGTIIKNEMPTLGRLCYISKNVDDEKLILILQMLEYINFGDDKISFWFGEENVDWKYDENGNVEDISTLASGVNGSRVFVQNVMVDELFEAISVQEVFKAGADFWLYDCIWRENDREQYQYKLDLLKETNYNDMYVLFNDKFTTLYQTYFEDWVYNDVDVEETWDEYMEALDALGYHIMMDELEQIQPLDEMILNFIS